jgi:hypothetical protein
MTTITMRSAGPGARHVKQRRLQRQLLQDLQASHPVDMRPEAETELCPALVGERRLQRNPSSSRRHGLHVIELQPQSGCSSSTIRQEVSVFF